MSAHQALVILQQARAETKPSEQALIEFEFEFDIAAALEDWASRSTEEGLSLVEKELQQELRRIDIQINGLSLKLPEDSSEEEEEEQTAEFKESEGSEGSEGSESSKRSQKFLAKLQEENSKLKALLQQCPELIYFFNQSTGFSLAFANEYGLRGLDDLMLQPWRSAGKESQKNRENQVADPPRQLNIQLETDEKSGRQTLVLTGNSRKADLPYFEGSEQDKVVCILCFDESVLRVPIDPKTKKFQGKAKISGELLLGNSQTQTPQEFKALIQKISASKSHPALARSLPDLEKTELHQTKSALKMIAIPLRPRNSTLFLTPILGAGVLSGVACALFLLSVVAPPLGLGLIASALIAGGIGFLLGLGMDAIRVRNYSKTKNQYSRTLKSNQDKVAKLFAPDIRDQISPPERVASTISPLLNSPVQ
jgi:hypothetical protein